MLTDWPVLGSVAGVDRLAGLGFSSWCGQTGRSWVQQMVLTDWQVLGSADGVDRLAGLGFSRWCGQTGRSWVQ